MRVNRFAGCLATAVLLSWGCAAERPSSPLADSPALNVASSGGRLEVCKIGPNSTTATFTISATGGQVLVSSPFTLDALADVGCVGPSDASVFNSMPVWLPDPNADPTQNVTVTLTEVGATPGIQLDRITAFTDLGNQDLYAPETSITVTVGSTSSGVVLFKNSGSPRCTDQAATNFGGELPCLYGKTFSIGPSSMEGHLKIPINSWFNGGYSFKFKNGVHVATDFTVQARVEVPVTCPYGGSPGGTILIPLGTVVYHVPANNTAWLPTGDANSILSWMGAVRSPDLCGGYPMDNARGAIFTATVAQNPVTGSLVDFRFKYRDPAAKGKVDTNCTDPNEPKRNDAATCGASWSQTVTDP